MTNGITKRIRRDKFLLKLSPAKIGAIRFIKLDRDTIKEIDACTLAS